MDSDEHHQAVRSIFEFLQPRLEAVATALVDDPRAALDEASRRFDEMLPDLAYTDDPAHPMALPLFFCTANLAMYLTLRERGVGVHDYGRTMLEDFAVNPMPEPDVTEQMPALAAAAEASQADTKPGEFVFEVLTEGDGFDWGINIKSCGICFQFSKYGAMELVPYMCATDDVMSDRADDGLRRTGTIALGAHQCDFRYQRGGAPKPVAEQYPDRIRIRSARST